MFSSRCSSAAWLVTLLYVAWVDVEAKPVTDGESLNNPCFAPDRDPAQKLEFNAYFGREEIARSVAQRISPQVFAVGVRRSVEGHDWILIARYRELPTALDHQAHSQRLTELARDEGGRYPGFICSGPPIRFHDLRPSQAVAQGTQEVM